MNRQDWQERKRPLRLEKRYEFDSYEALRDFLDGAAELSEQQGLFPDIGFNRSHANFTIHAEDGVESMSEKQREFAALLDTLGESTQKS